MRTAAYAIAIFLPLSSISYADHGEIIMDIRSNKEWARTLTPEQYEILRNEGTEPAYSSPLDAEKREGTFVCAACELPLFKSSTKYDSKTGWPSFTQPIKNHVQTKIDWKILYPRTEYHCAKCESHQGHIFNDGPASTGKRYCNNGLALKFIPKKDKNA